MVASHILHASPSYPNPWGDAIVPTLRDADSLRKGYQALGGGWYQMAGLIGDSRLSC